MTCKWEGKHKDHNVSSIREPNNFDRRSLEKKAQLLRSDLDRIKSIPRTAEDIITKIGERKE